MQNDIAEFKAVSFTQYFVQCSIISYLSSLRILKYKIINILFSKTIEYGIFGEGSQISTNQKRESTVFSLLIGQNLRPFPENTVLY